MNSKYTLKLNKEFKRLYYRGKCAVTRTVVVYVQKNRFGHNRVGLTCGKSVGNAVKRSRAKRLMRESYRLILPDMRQGYDIVIIARTGILGKKCVNVMKDARYAFTKLGLML